MFRSDTNPVHSADLQSTSAWYVSLSGPTISLLLMRTLAARGMSGCVSLYPLIVAPAVVIV